MDTVEEAIRRMVRSMIQDELAFERQLATLGPDGASPRTITPPSKEDRSAVVFDTLVEQAEAGRLAAERRATNHGSQASSSPQMIPALSRLATKLGMELSHVASCSSCQESPEQLLSLSKTLAQAAAGLSESTSPSEATSSPVAPELEPATSGLNRCTNCGNAAIAGRALCLSCRMADPDQFDARRKAEEAYQAETNGLSEAELLYAEADNQLWEARFQSAKRAGWTNLAAARASWDVVLEQRTRRGDPTLVPEEWKPIETKGPGQVMNVFKLEEGWETRCVAMVPLTFEFRQARRPWPRCDALKAYLNSPSDRCIKSAGHSGEHEY